MRGRLQGHDIMMGGNYGAMGGYGGSWGMLLLVIVVVGIVVWIAMRGGK